MPDALQMLRDDHHHMKDLFKRFENSDDAASKGRIVAEALKALRIHAELEEEIFYPAVLREADPDDGLMDEAEEEHHVAKVLIGELERMTPSAPRYHAKFTVLAENVKHHIEEEESEMLPKAAELGTQRMSELGAAMAERRRKLTNSSAHKSKPRTRAASSANGKRPSAPRRTATRPSPTLTHKRTTASKSASPHRTSTSQRGARATDRRA